MAISIIISNGSTKANVTNMVKSVSWSGDENTLARTLDVTMHNTNDVNGGKKLFGYGVGNAVFAYDNGSEFFRGTIFKQSISESGEDSFTAYDELVYTTKNNESIFIKNKTADQVIISLCHKYGVSIGSIEKTGYSIPKLFCDNKSLADIFIDCLEETKKHKGKSYKIYSKKGKVYMVSREQATRLTISVNDVISASKDISIEDLRTHVKIIKGSVDPNGSDTKFATLTVSDKALASKYGIMQHIEKADDKDTLAKMKTKANQILKDMKSPETTASIDFIGNIACTTGNIIDIHDEITGIMGRYYISTDSHSWDSGVHKMSLQLSKKIGELDNGDNDYGSEPKKEPVKKPKKKVTKKK